MGKGSRRQQNVLSMLRDIVGIDDDLSADDPFVQSLIEHGRRGQSMPLADQWEDVLVDFYQNFPDRLMEYVESSCGDFTVQVTDVFQNVELHGKVRDDDGVQANVFVCLEPESDKYAEFGCNVCDLEENYLCHHIGRFVEHVCGQLEGRSKLRNQINNKRFTQGKPDRSVFRLDTSMRVLKELTILADRLPAFVDESFDEAQLPPPQEVRSERVCWCFSMVDSRLKVEPRLQQRKKRGDGFTKGKKLSYQRLVTDRDLPLSDIDQKVVQCVRLQDHYYYGEESYELGPLDAMIALAGHANENVLLDEKPLTIEHGLPVITVKKNDDGLLAFAVQLPWEDANEESLRLSLGGAGAGVIECSLGRARVSAADNATQLALGQLIKSTPFDPSLIDELIPQLDSIAKYVSIQIPEEFAGPSETESTESVVILRSHADGKLDYGVRVRTPSGVLKLPGAAPLARSEERQGKVVRLVRDGEREIQRAQSLAATLNLSGYDQNWFGTIDELPSALELVEKLQGEDVDAEVLWDKTTVKPLSVLGSLSSNNVKVDIGSKRNWFGITGECKVGQNSLPLHELLDRLPVGDQTVGDFVQLNDGGWARISDQLRKRLVRLRDATHTDRKTLKLDATAAPAVRDLMEQDVEVKANKAWEKCLKRLAKAETIDPQLPANLDADLREYQVEGYRWLARLAAWGVGGVLADDMGLGKTLQTLAVLLDRAADGPALVIAPTSVGFNWVREAERFAPDLDVHLYRETERADFLPTVGPNMLVICSYGLALRDAEALSGVDWNTMVLDEAQAIKNSRSKTSKAIATIQADWTVALTGTPVENHLGELWSLFHVVSPGVFGGWDQFRSRFATPIEKQQDADSRDALAARIQPFVLRRTKEEVLTDLPPRTESNLYVELSPAERAEYEKIRLEALGEVEVIETLPNVQDQRFKILALMTRLRQIACHAKLANASWTGSSAKLDQLCQTLESLREEGHRALVFSQFTSHLALIREALTERGFTYEYLDGSTAPKARQEAVDRFQTGDANAFLISLKAGGTGLNLTAADYVIHMDPWWNPAVEDQATDRAHRYGQDKPVIVYRIVAKGTIEEEILALHESKRDLVEGVMQGTQAAAKLTNEDLIRMLRQD